MKSLFLTSAIVLPALVFAFWPSRAAVLPTLPGDGAVEHHNSTSALDSLVEAVRDFGPDVFIQESKLVATDGAPNDQLGWDVAIFGNTAIVGARFDDIGSNGNQGSAYVFARTGSSWVLQQKLIAPDGATNDLFGADVAIDGETVVVGTRFNTSPGRHTFFPAAERFGF